MVVVSGDNKWRIVTQRVWHGDREWPLNDRQIPNSRGVRVRVSKGTWVTPDGERTYEQRLHFVVPPPKQQQLRNQVQRFAHLGHIRRWVHQLQHLPAKHPPPVSGGHPRNQTLTLLVAGAEPAVRHAVRRGGARAGVRTVSASLAHSRPSSYAAARSYSLALSRRSPARVAMFALGVRDASTGDIAADAAAGGLNFSVQTADVRRPLPR